MRARFLDPLISEKRPVADEFPAFADLKVGRDDRLWIREFVSPASRAQPRWLAFDANGHFQCAAAIPAFENLFEIGADYLLALTRDEAGVERVVQHSLGRPTP
ncbi:MAG: hypothetical protein WEE89_23040 [Gemmatimonadota bacterium]